MNQLEDLPIHDLIDAVTPFMLEYPVLFYPKWTCPRCGQRCTASDPLLIEDMVVRYPEHYEHDGCGEKVDTDTFKFGVRMEVLVPVVAVQMPPTHMTVGLN